MDLQTMHFFVTAADTGSFSAAAEALNYAQSNLSSRIKQLEEEISEPLFYRHRRGISLTSKGQIFYDYAVRILRLSEEAVISVHNTEHARGQLRIGALEAIVLEDLPEILSAYHGLYPDVKLTILTDMNIHLQDLVLSRSLDGAFVAEPVSHPDLISRAFSVKRLILVGSAIEKHLSTEEILSEGSFITFPEGSAFRHRLEMLLSTYSINYLNRMHIANSLSVNIANVCAGIGFGYLPETSMETYISQGLLKKYQIDDPFSELKVVFIYRSDRIMDAAFRYFLEMLHKDDSLS